MRPLPGQPRRDSCSHKLKNGDSRLVNDLDHVVMQEVRSEKELTVFHCLCQCSPRRHNPHSIAKILWRTKGEINYTPCMDEGRKRVLLIAAAILAARRLAQHEGGIRVPATASAVADAIRWAEQLMNEIDRRFPTS